MHSTVNGKNPRWWGLEGVIRTTNPYTSAEMQQKPCGGVEEASAGNNN